MKNALLLSLSMFLCAGSAHAASAVAIADDMTYGYSFNLPTEDAAKAAALRSCSRRTNRRCEIKVSCDGPGFGAVSASGTAGPRRALGASCGAASAYDAYLQAQASCNQAGAGRCGAPRTAWRDAS